jgi:hypothetical protein
LRFQRGNKVGGLRRVMGACEKGHDAGDRKVENQTAILVACQ